MKFPLSIHEVPFFRLLIPLWLGIVVQFYIGVIPSVSEFVLIPLFAFTLLIIAYSLSRFWALRLVFGIVLNLFLFLLGLILTVSWSYSAELTPKTSSRAIIRLLESPQFRVRSIRVTCQVDEFLVDRNYQTSQEKILVYFDIADSLANNLRYGDVIAARIEVQAFDAPKNPNQFDVGKYMHLNGIRYSAHIKPDDWIFLSNRGNRLVELSLGLREYFLSQFKVYGIDGQQFAVLSALSLGYKDFLDDELRRVYSSTGAMHILAVSGLHVGILYFLLASVLLFLPGGKISRYGKLFVVLIFLWFFALLTGLSPSVCRSALMFSLVAIGQCFNARSNIYNTLAVAAFVLLVINPMNLFNIGFQLSFVAVLSIVVFHPYIYGLIHFKSRIFDYVWSLIAVSVAAQIGTFPLTAAYFSQFPNYFIITNLIAIPLATAILYLAVLLLIVSFIPAIAIWVGRILNALLLFLNSALQWVDSLPGSQIKGVHISSLQLFVLILCIVFVALFLYKRRLFYFQVIMGTLVVVLIVGFINGFKIAKNELVVFSKPYESIICVKRSGVANFLVSETEDPLLSNAFYLSGYVSKQTISGRYRFFNINLPVDSLLDFAVRKAYGLAIVNSDDMSIALPYNDSLRFARSDRSIDVKILMANKYFTESSLDFIRPELVIIDNSFPKRKLNKLLILLVEKEIRFHSLNADGAYRIKTH